jgi:hypothetical protein
MALTRKIPIHDFVFMRSDVVDLIKLISADYRPSRDKSPASVYSIEISENDTTTVSQDSPPKNFESLFTTPIERITLMVRTGGGGRSAYLDLRHGDNYQYSNLRLHGDDEDWVNLTHEKVIKKLAGVARQNSFIRTYGASLRVMLTIAFGWCILRVLTYYSIHFLGVHWVQMSWSQLGRDIVFGSMLGFVPAALFVERLRQSFPSIELRTGAEHTWKEARRQRYLKAAFSIAILGPSGDIIKEIYRQIIK